MRWHALVSSFIAAAGVLCVSQPARTIQVKTWSNSMACNCSLGADKKARLSKGGWELLQFSRQFTRLESQI